jgi:hypothetical protein
MRCSRCEELQEELRQLKLALLDDAIEQKFQNILRLTPVEARILTYLYKRFPNSALVDVLAEATSSESTAKSVDVRICIIRRVLGKDAIETTRGSRKLSSSMKEKLDRILTGEQLKFTPRAVTSRAENVQAVLTHLSSVPHAEASTLIAIAPSVRLNYLWKNGWIRHMSKQQKGTPGVYAITLEGLKKCQHFQTTTQPK